MTYDKFVILFFFAVSVFQAFRIYFLLKKNEGLWEIIKKQRETMRKQRELINEATKQVEKITRTMYGKDGEIPVKVITPHKFNCNLLKDWEKK